MSTFVAGSSIRTTRVPSGVLTRRTVATKPAMSVTPAPRPPRGRRGRRSSPRPPS
jgi:hypothetical protein